MKEIEVHAWCDWVHPDRVPAVVEVRLSMNGGVEHLLDLCADHDMLLSAVFERAGVVPAIQAGRTRGPGGRPPISGPHICPVCGSEHRSRNAMTKHLRAAHQTSIKELEAASQR